MPEMAETFTESSETKVGPEARCEVMPRWPLERALFLLGGTMTLLSAALAAFVSPWFLLLTVLVGLNQWLYVAIGACPASFVIRKVFGLRSAFRE